MGCVQEAYMVLHREVFTGNLYYILHSAVVTNKGLGKSSWHLFCRWEFSTCQKHLALVDLQFFLMSFGSKNFTFKPSVTGHVVSLHLPQLLRRVYPVKCQTTLSFFRTGAEDSENLKKRLCLLEDQTAHHTNIPSGLSLGGGGSLYLPSQKGGQKDQASARPSYFCCSGVHFWRR